MRYLKDIPHPQLKMGLFAWNGKYILKVEVGMYEQTYKISEMDVSSEEEVVTLLDGPFLKKVAERFGQMHGDFMESAERNGIVL
ncbi:hypothetical protein [Tellurirhabdus rosea]|uniref:hypothetical protein n=1 Tax=Tellurirhabdus rosea TaxID=2674997 RepID=UPI00225B6CDF|nr:hypothetical protein [Tellurirhabdus rosea]